MGVFTARAFAMMMEYEWPGNIRELRNVIEHAFACVQGDTIERMHLPRHIRRVVSPESLDRPDTPNRERINKELILEVLQRYNGNRELTAQALNISRTTLWRKIKSLGIQSFRHP